MLDAYKLRGGLHQHILRTSWPQVVGPHLAAHTDEVILKGYKLIVKVSSPALKHELHYMRSQIAANANEVLGTTVVTEVVVQ